MEIYTQYISKSRALFQVLRTAPLAVVHPFCPAFLGLTRMCRADRVDTVLMEMDTHNKALGVAVEAAERERGRETSKKLASEMHVECPFTYEQMIQRQQYASPEQRAESVDPRQNHAVKLLSVSVHLEPSVGQHSTAAHALLFKQSKSSETAAKYDALREEQREEISGLGKENTTSARSVSANTTTPKAALRKRLLEARNALGGVRLGAAPKRSISFHPAFLKGVCDDDLV